MHRSPVDAKGARSLVFVARCERDGPFEGKTLRPGSLLHGTGATVHVYLEVAAAVLVIIPLFAVGRACRRTPSPRLLFALAAFSILEVRFAALVAMHTLISVDHVFHETFEFLTDLIVIALFAAAFLYATRWTHDRGRPELA